MTHGMRAFGLISTSIWQSEKFNRLSSDRARLSYMWLHTSSKTCAGVMRVGPAHLSEDVHHVSSLEMATEIFEDMENVGLIKWLRPYVVLNGYLKFNPVKTYKHAIGAYKEALALPDCEAKQVLIDQLQRQAGAMELTKWRNKSGDPHEILFRVHEFIERSAPDPAPSLTPLDEVSNPSVTPLDEVSSPVPNSTSKSKNIKEKGKEDLSQKTEETRGASEAAKKSQIAQNSMKDALRYGWPY